MVIETLRNIHINDRLVTGDVSAHTKSAQKITKKWQAQVCLGEIKSEVPVSPENSEKIDVVDFDNRIAYELKVSGKNTHHEFYKDLAKVLTFNQYQADNFRIRKFVFISEQSGIHSLSKRLDSRFVDLVFAVHGLEIELVSI